MPDFISIPLHDGFSPIAISFVLAAMGLNVHFGYAGLLNFGQAAFSAVGGYAMAVTIVSFDVPFLPAILLGLVASVLLSLVMGIPTLRLRADYLAIVTIAVAEVVRLVFTTSFKDYFNARDGVSGFTGSFRSWNPYPTDMGRFLSFNRVDLWVMTVGWILVALICLFLFAIMRSPWGRVLKSIREEGECPLRVVLVESIEYIHICLKLLGGTEDIAESCYLFTLMNGPWDRRHNHLPVAVGIVEMLVASPLDRVNVLPRVPTLEVTVGLEIIQNHMGQLSATNQLTSV